MCLAIPAQVVELQEQGMARVRVGESQTYLTASMLLLPEPPKVGDYVIVHAGFALHSLTPEQAQESLAALREVAEAIEGQKPLFGSATTAKGFPAGKLRQAVHAACGAFGPPGKARSRMRRSALVPAAAFSGGKARHSGLSCCPFLDFTNVFAET